MLVSEFLDPEQALLVELARRRAEEFGKGTERKPLVSCFHFPELILQFFFRKLRDVLMAPGMVSDQVSPPDNFHEEFAFPLNEIPCYEKCAFYIFFIQNIEDFHKPAVVITGIESKKDDFFIFRSDIIGRSPLDLLRIDADVGLLVVGVSFKTPAVTSGMYGRKRD